MRLVEPSPAELARAGIRLIKAQLLCAICDYLDAEYIRWHRLNSGLAVIAGARGKRKVMRDRQAGTPDLLALVPAERCPGCGMWRPSMNQFGRSKCCARSPDVFCLPLYLKVKVLGGKLSDDQKAWLATASADGIACAVVWSLDAACAAVAAVRDGRMRL